MKKNIFSLLLLTISYFAFSQPNMKNAPIHNVKEIPFHRCNRYETKAYIDSTLWSHYLNWNLFLDSAKRRQLPDSLFKIPVSYVIDKNGRVASVKTYTNPHGLGTLIEEKLSNFPHTWLPATQNFQPVKSYHRLIIVFNNKHSKQDL